MIYQCFGFNNFEWQITFRNFVCRNLKETNKCFGSVLNKSTVTDL